MDFDAFEISPAAFAERQAWARRQGNMLWLWPDIPSPRWRRTVEALEIAVREVLTRGAARLCPPGDLATLSLAAYTSGTGPLVGYWIEQGWLETDTEASALFAFHLDHNRRRMRALATSTCAIAERLDQAGVRATVLKGMHLAHDHYPDPGTRPVSDIDLLARPIEAFRRASDVLADGFSIIYQSPRETTWAPTGSCRAPRSLLHVHHDDPWAVDLHNSLDYQPSPASPATRIDSIADGGTGPRWQPDPRVGTLAQPALLLHLAAHIGGSVRMNPSLIRLIDLILVIRGDLSAGRLDWDAFLAAGAASNSLRLAYPALALAEKLVPGTVPSPVLRACESASTHGARRLVRTLTPAAAQRLERVSIREHYMWVRGPVELMRQLGTDILPSMPWREMPARYLALARSVMSGGFGR